MITNWRWNTIFTCQPTDSPDFPDMLGAMASDLRIGSYLEFVLLRRRWSYCPGYVSCIQGLVRSSGPACCRPFVAPLSRALLSTNRAGPCLWPWSVGPSGQAFLSPWACSYPLVFHRSHTLSNHFLPTWPHSHSSALGVKSRAAVEWLSPKSNLLDFW